MAFNFKLAKYKNKKVSINGIIFDSQKEASHYWDLWVRQENGEIRDLMPNTETKKKKVFELIPPQNGGKRNELAVKYIPDFYYYDNIKKEWVVEDVKSKMTRKLPDYVIKRKLMKWVHNIEVDEII
ncbi:MAG: DUF1064 domain-containing protein [Solobacterium sp.]|nr:DUF1064 domain-containing protein [Solobacterium sp.]